MYLKSNYTLPLWEQFNVLSWICTSRRQMKISDKQWTQSLGGHWLVTWYLGVSSLSTAHWANATEKSNVQFLHRAVMEVPHGIRAQAVAQTAYFGTRFARIGCARFQVPIDAQDVCSWVPNCFIFLDAHKRHSYDVHFTLMYCSEGSCLPAGRHQFQMNEITCRLSSTDLLCLFLHLALICLFDIRVRSAIIVHASSESCR